MVDLSVIIVSYNTKKLLKDCLSSVFQQEGVTFEIWVVDNASSDASPEMVQKDFPQAQLVKNKKNLGFAAANNQAMAKAKGRYLLLLNSDTVVHVGNFATMVSWMDERPKVGISTCSIQAGSTISPPRSPSGHLRGGLEGKFQSVGGFFPTLGRVILWMTFLDDLPLLNRYAYHLPADMISPPRSPSGHLGGGESQVRQTHCYLGGEKKEEKSLSLDWVTGAYFFLRREVYERVGNLAEDFFMYVEEVEYCLRAKRAGWQVVFVPVTSIIHLGSASSTLGSQVAILGEYRSLIRLYEKQFPSWQLPLVRFWLKLGALLRVILFGYGKRDHQARKTYGKAFQMV